MNERAAPVPSSLAGAAGPSAAGASRWSGDGWLYLRRGHGAPALGTLGPTYGASQFGAVLRYALAPGPRARAFGYLRVAGAMDAPFRDRHLALGLGLRPVRHLPVAVLMEARVQQGGRDTHVRPAVALVSEVQPLALPLGAEAEIYGQGGWVGGRDATAFFDLQAVADRSVLRPSIDADLRLGAGVWSGGQKGAVRLDAGPRVSLRTAIGGVPARLALDWRFRVAGDAAPRSGPALTVSAGF
ncbi:hypothetical protein [Novosphingobium sp. KCTC 2891]|uniref:hypothetical protein n=1 Tax=Novosphingobium sp. KCTC 2891 TaxID=2989730 RepID=UPI00222310D7|nr:hypothetical protein [Novosphingobium sp. KCTC 2891]